MELKTKSRKNFDTDVILSPFTKKKKFIAEITIEDPIMFLLGNPAYDFREEIEKRYLNTCYDECFIYEIISINSSSSKLEISNNESNIGSGNITLFFEAKIIKINKNDIIHGMKFKENKKMINIFKYSILLCSVMKEKLVTDNNKMFPIRVVDIFYEFLSSHISIVGEIFIAIPREISVVLTKVSKFNILPETEKNIKDILVKTSILIKNNPTIKKYFNIKGNDNILQFLISKNDKVKTLKYFENSLSIYFELTEKTSAKKDIKLPENKQISKKDFVNEMYENLVKMYNYASFFCENYLKKNDEVVLKNIELLPTK